MVKNCTTCAFREGQSSDHCRHCEIASIQAGSCTGVKYFCTFHCEECFFDQIYNTRPPCAGKREDMPQ